MLIKILVILIFGITFYDFTYAKDIRSETLINKLNQEVADAKRYAELLRDEADKVDSKVWIGTMWNEASIPQHTCYALGILLELETSVSHLKPILSTRISAKNKEDAYELRVMAQRLENLQYAVRNTLNLTQAQRAKTWDLDCMGFHNIPITQSQYSATNTWYEVVNDGEGLRILGEIQIGYTQNLMNALRKYPNVQFIALGSAGGSVSEAISAGRLLRKKGLTTTLWNNCYSACPFVFMGGKERYINSPYPSLGFHRLYSKQNNTSTPYPRNSYVYQRVTNYLNEMGVDKTYVLDAIFKANPSEINLIHGADKNLCSSNIATWIQRACSN